MIRVNHHRSEPQRPPNTIPNLLLILAPPLTPHLGSLNISRTLIIRLSQHAHDRDQYLLHTLDRAPPLVRMLVVIRVIAWRMEDADADESAGIYCPSHNQVSLPIPNHTSSIKGGRGI